MGSGPGDQFRSVVADARDDVTRRLGPVIVATIEGMGYRLVPAGIVDLFEKIVAQQPAPSESSGPASGEDPR